MGGKRNAASEKPRNVGSRPRKASESKIKRQRTLQHVDIIELQAFQALLHRIKDVFPALAILVHVAEAVGILRTPKEFPGITANREVKLGVSRTFSAHGGGCFIEGVVI
jgi:hypothetical protein